MNQLGFPHHKDKQYGYCGNQRTEHPEARQPFLAGLKNSRKGYFLWSFQLPPSIQQALNESHQKTSASQQTKRKQLSTKEAL